jgi:hypothetical protein
MHLLGLRTLHRSNFFDPLLALHLLCVIIIIIIIIKLPN